MWQDCSKGVLIQSPQTCIDLTVNDHNLVLTSIFVASNIVKHPLVANRTLTLYINDTVGLGGGLISGALFIKEWSITFRSAHWDNAFLSSTLVSSSTFQSLILLLNHRAEPNLGGRRLGVRMKDFAFFSAYIFSSACQWDFLMCCRGMGITFTHPHTSHAYFENKKKKLNCHLMNVYMENLGWWQYTSYVG